MAGNVAGIRAGKAYVELGADDSKLRKALDGASTRLKSFGAGVATIGVSMAGLGVAIAAPLFAASKMFADAGSELADMSARTGMSVEALSALGHAATQTGTDLATVEGAARKMQKNLVAAATGSQEAEIAFASLGLSVDRLVKMSPDEQFAAVARAIARIPSPTAKAAAAMQLLGKSGTALVPMIDDLDALTTEAKRLGLVMSTEDAQAADALGDALDIVVKVIKRAAVTIGAALAPVLTDLAGTIASSIVAVTNWIRANSGIVTMAATVATGLVAAGGAFVVLGGVISGLGSVLGMVSSAIGVVGTVLGAVLTPVGLITAALVAGAVAWARYSESGQAAMAWLGDQFGALYTTATDTFRGIADAMMAGDLALAGQVLWAGLEVAWIQGTNALTAIWRDWSTAAIEVVRSLQFGVAGVMIDLWASIESIWASGMANLSGSWQTVLSNLVQSLIPFKDVIAQVFGVDVGKAIDDALGVNPEDRARQQADLAAEQARIEANRQGARAVLGQDQQTEVDARRNANAQADAAALAELEKAKADLAALAGQADNLRRVKEASTPGGGKPVAADMPSLDPAELDAALSQAKAKIDVAGSFSAAAFKGLGVGDSVQNDQLKEQQKQTKELTALNRKVDKAKLVLTD